MRKRLEKHEEGLAVLDLIVSGGLVVTPTGKLQLDLAIKDGMIVGLYESGSSDVAAHRTFDATNQLVVPGGIDPHVHCDWPVHDPRTGGMTTTEGPGVVSEAALLGGTTTLVDFVTVPSDQSIQQAIATKEDAWTANSRCDFGLHLILQGRLATDTLGQVREAVESGFVSLKVFTTNIWPRLTGRRIDFGSLWELMRISAGSGSVIAVHAEDDELVMYMHEVLDREGRMGFEHLAEAHSAMSEDLAFRRVLGLASHTEGARLYMMHVSAALGVEAIAEYRQRGVAVTGETLPQYALHTSDDYHTHDGMKYHTYPSLKGVADCDALWAGMRDGVISTLATDELCTSYELKTAGRRIDNVVGGNTGVQPRMAIAYTEMVVNRQFPVQRFVELTSTNAAKVLGMYPRKGTIAVGSDADLAIIDTTVDRPITVGDLRESDYTPWEGWRVKAWPTATVLRGEVVAERGQLGPFRPGHLVPRRMGTDWL
jgi:dihydropyrimidinase